VLERFIALNQEIARHIEEIGQDKIHGASWLSRQALKVMGLAIETSEAKTAAQFIKELKEVGSGLRDSKPSMASITNSVSRFVYEISMKSRVEEDLIALKNFAHLMGNEIIKNSEESFRKTTGHGAGLVGKGDKLVTCSYSSTVCQALRIAKFDGKNFAVKVAESRFGSKVYGEVTSGELKSYGIEAEIIPDGAIEDGLSMVNKVLVGADSLLSDGSLVNGVPTCNIAWAAKKSQVPFYTLCETGKFDAWSYLGQSRELEEGFDHIPPHLITGIITEDGIAKPEEILGYIRELATYNLALLNDRK